MPRIPPIGPKELGGDGGLIGGCSGTRYGCCTDGVTSKNEDGSNCPGTQNIGGCAGTRYGCCTDGVTAKNEDGSNCQDSICMQETDVVFVGPNRTPVIGQCVNENVNGYTSFVVESGEIVSSTILTV